ncbi:MAG TPA: Mur ligase domain-containing protein, partial [Alphaproteobacteria bacterium]|nr:Mur ligase domain-containing protein [Alphaproteobacteria bacterium]
MDQLTFPANVTMITSDSRAIEKGGMFVAISGAHHDGRAFIKSAIEKGAKYIVIGKGSAVTPVNNVEFIEVNNPRQYLALAA